MTASNDKQKDLDETLPEKREDLARETAHHDRRAILRTLVAGTAFVAGYSALPKQWTAPLAEFGTLPAHATTSGVVKTSSETKESKPKEPTPKEPTPKTTGSGSFSLLFEMTYQSCASCGIWFDSAELVIVHSAGTYRASQRGSLLIKKTPHRQGRFRADIRSIPSSATIRSATLYMNLNRQEGIANSDSSSEIAVYDFSSGSRGRYVRKITAKHDIKGRGYSKSKPRVPIDFTRYAREVHG